VKSLIIPNSNKFITIYLPELQPRSQKLTVVDKIMMMRNIITKFHTVHTQFLPDLLNCRWYRWTLQH